MAAVQATRIYIKKYRLQNSSKTVTDSICSAKMMTNYGVKLHHL